MLIPFQSARAEVDAELLEKMDALAKDGYAGLEVWTSAPSVKTKGATFGHTMLRFVDHDDNALNDLVLSFRATIPEGEEMKISKALAHEYEMGMDFGSVQSFWSLYLLWQERPIYRHIVLSTNLLRQNLLRSLRAELVANDGVFGQYALLDNSCLSVVLNLLKSAGFPLLKRNEILPTRIDEYLNNAYLAPFVLDEIEMPDSLAAIQEKVQAALQSKNLMALSSEEIQSFLQFPPVGFPFRSRGVLADELTRRIEAGSASFVPLEKLMNLDIVPKPMYELCLNSDCVEEVAQVYSQFKSDAGVSARLRLSNIRENSELMRSRKMRDRGKNLSRVSQKVSDPLDMLSLYKSYYEELGRTFDDSSR